MKLIGVFGQVFDDLGDDVAEAGIFLNLFNSSRT